MDIIASVIAERVERLPNGNLSAIAMFNTLFASDFPAFAGEMVLLLRTVYRASEATGQAVPMSVRLTNFDGDRLFDARQDVTLSPPPPPFTWAQWDYAFSMQGLPLEKEGEYTFEIWISGVQRAVIPLLVVHVPPGKTPADVSPRHPV